MPMTRVSTPQPQVEADFTPSALGHQDGPVAAEDPDPDSSSSHIQRSRPRSLANGVRKFRFSAVVTCNPLQIAGMPPVSFVRRVALIVLGSAILTFGVHNIHDVTGVTEGGVIGAMLFVDNWFGVPASIASPALDFACYAIALRVLGGGFLGWSAVASVAVAGFYALWERLPHLLPDLSGNPLLAAVLGGIFVGIGAGLVVRQGGSSGGDDALALSISHLTGWRVARCYLMMDLTVLALSLSYIPVARIACSLVTVTISSFLIDMVKDASWDRVFTLMDSLRIGRLSRAVRPDPRAEALGEQD